MFALKFCSHLSDPILSAKKPGAQVMHIPIPCENVPFGHGSIFERSWQENPTGQFILPFSLYSLPKFCVMYIPKTNKYLNNNIICFILNFILD